MTNKDESLEIERFTLTDEEGNESEFEMLASLEIDGKTYVALSPIEDEEAEEAEYVILRVDIEEDGAEVLVTIDDDEEFDRVADEFGDAFEGEFDCDAHGLHTDDDCNCEGCDDCSEDDNEE